MPARFRVGDCHLDVAANELTGQDGRVNRIEPRLMALLVRLARTPGGVVSRETLIDEVWTRRMVNDEVLSRAIADLRNVLGDDSRAPRYIETIPKSGYRLIAPVTMPPPPGAQAVTPTALRRTNWPVWFAGALAALLLSTAAVIVSLRQAPQPGGLALAQSVEAALREAQPLTAGPGLEVVPRLSPDGKRVLYLSVVDGRSTLMLHDPARPAPEAMSETAEDVTSAVFMPDGAGILYRALAAGAGTVCRLRLRTAGGVRDVAVCAREEPSRIDVSPDGKWLVRSKAHRESFPAGLVLQSLVSDELRTLTTPGVEDGEDSLARFSPDGSTIAFVRGNSSARAVWLIPSSGGTARRVGALTGLTYGLAWAPDGGALLVAADWFGFRALNWLELKDGSGRLIGARGARSPDFAAGRIVYENAEFEANLQRVRLQGGSVPVVLHPSTRYTSQPVYSPDGGALAFVSNREGMEAVYVANRDGMRRLPLPDSHRYMRPQWSADGQAIYAIRMQAGGGHGTPQQAVRIVLADGRTSVLPLGEKVGFIGESRDGRWLYLGEREARLMRMWRAPIDAPARQERLPIPLVGDFQLSRSHLAFTQTGLPGFTVCTLDGQACDLKRLPAGDRHEDHWALSEGGLYFVEGRSAARRLARLDLKSGVTAPVSMAVPTTLGAGLAVHPREDEIIVAREAPPRIDLMSATLTRH